MSPRKKPTIKPPQKKSSSVSPKLGLNLGPKTTAEMAAIGIRTLAQLKALGWQKAMIKLIAKYPERLNLNMIAALIGACTSKDWRKISLHERHEARQFIKQHKPKKPRNATSASPATSAADRSFVDFVVQDQLASLPIEPRRMFGGTGLYVAGTFFGIIAGGVLFFKTSEESRIKYVEAGMEPFEPKPGQVIRRYYQVPVDILENPSRLHQWASEAIAVARAG